MNACPPCPPAGAPILLALALGLGPGSPVAQESTVPEEQDGPAERVLQLTLEDALRIALENNLDLELEEISTESAEFSALGSWGAFDPVVSLTGSASDRDSPAQNDFAGADVVEEDSLVLDSSISAPFPTGTTFDLSYRRSNDRTNSQFATFDTSTTDVITATLTQPLLRGAFERYATTDQREAETDYLIQRERENEVRHRIVLDVCNAYWDLVSAREELAVRVQAVAVGQRQLEQDQRRLDVGAGTEVDVLQSQTNVAQQEETRIQAEFDLRSAEDALRRLLFQKPGSDLDAFLDSWDWPIVPLTALPELTSEQDFVHDLSWRHSLDQATQLRPELWQRRIEIDQAEVRLERSRSNRLPQLDLQLRATSLGFDVDPDEALSQSTSFDFPEYEGSVIFSLPIRNRSASYAERAAESAVRSSRLSYDRQELEILAEVRAAVRDVRFRIESVQAAQTSMELAQRQLEAEEARREIGLSTTFQVLEFQQDLAEALSAERASRANYAKALAGLGNAEGSLVQNPVRWSPQDANREADRNE